MKQQNRGQTERLGKKEIITQKSQTVLTLLTQNQDSQNFCIGYRKVEIQNKLNEREKVGGIFSEGLNFQKYFHTAEISK